LVRPDVVGATVMDCAILLCPSAVQFSRGSRIMMWTSHAQRLDDGALLGAMALGDQSAGEVFVRRHQRTVYGLAFTMCRDNRLAEDLSQQTFERVWKHAESYDPRRASVRVWMLTITRRLCIDVFRANRSQPTDPFELMSLLPHDRQSVEDLGIARTEVAKLREVLAALPEEQRRALILASLAGHTTAEIAQMENIPIGTAKTRLRTALMRVRRELIETGADDV
jgi:RNA polymerase sigma factor (sigma-70 family)